MKEFAVYYENDVEVVCSVVPPDITCFKELNGSVKTEKKYLYLEFSKVMTTVS